GHRVALVHAPAGFQLGGLPADVGLDRELTKGERFDVILFFAQSLSDVRRQFAKVAAHLRPAGGLWIAWPKKTSGIATDLSENPIRNIGLAAGLVDNKVCAVDETWSGLRFVIRLKDR